MPRQVFTAGEILTAASMNDLSDATVMVFDDSAARGSAIPSPSEGMVTYLKDEDSWQGYTTDWGPLASGFTDSETITATDATWSVPTLASPIVKVTAIGGGGGGGRSGNAGGAGGNTSFDAGGAGTVTGLGGAGGLSAFGGVSGNTGLRAANYGGGGNVADNVGPDGKSGVVTVGYLDLTGISTVNVTIGAGGAASGDAGAGGRGEVIVEYVAG